MRIMIIGAGEVGYYLSEKFSIEEHDVVLIERNEEKLRYQSKELDILTVHGSGGSAHVLEQAGIEKCDLFIAVTDTDEVNLISCLMAREYGVKRLVARVRNPELLSAGSPLNQQRLGLDLLINPDRVMADEVVRLCDLSEAFEVIDFAHGHVELVGYRIEDGHTACGKSLKILGKMRGELGFVVVAIIRGEETIVPRGEDVIQAGDRIFMVARRSDIPAIESMFLFRSTSPKRVFIIGGGRLGLMVASELEKRDIEVRLMEIDPDRCSYLSEKLEKTIVLNSDGLQAHELLEEGIEETDLIISATGNDTTNLLSSLLAKHHGAKKCITRIKRSDFVPLLGKLGIDVALSSRMLVARAILRFVRKGAILSAATLLETDSEVLELVVPDKAEICNTPLQDIGFPDGANIGAVVRNGKLVVPVGSTTLQTGDDVVVFALKKAVPMIEKFFEA